MEKKLGSDSRCKLKLSIVTVITLYQSSVKTKMDKDGIHIGVATQIAVNWNQSSPNRSRLFKLWHFNSYHDFFQRKRTVLGSVATISHLAGGPAARGPLGQWQGDGVGPGPTGRGLKAVLVMENQRNANVESFRSVRLPCRK